MAGKIHRLKTRSKKTTTHHGAATASSRMRRMDKFQAFAQTIFSGVINGNLNRLIRPSGDGGIQVSPELGASLGVDSDQSYSSDQLAHEAAAHWESRKAA